MLTTTAYIIKWSPSTSNHHSQHESNPGRSFQMNHVISKSIELQSISLLTKLLLLSTSHTSISPSVATTLLHQLESLLPTDTPLLHLPGILALRVCLHMLACPTGSSYPSDYSGLTFTGINSAKDIIQSTLKAHADGAFGGIYYPLLLNVCGRFFLRHNCPQEAAVLLEKELALLDTDSKEF
ncbi:unnamed protein product, partial [Protopolystoma xenopodis]